MKTYIAIFRTNADLDGFEECAKIVRGNTIKGRQCTTSISYAYIRVSLGAGYEYSVSGNMRKNTLYVDYEVPS